jgi:hypothetical protein
MSKCGLGHAGGQRADMDSRRPADEYLGIRLVRFASVLVPVARLQNSPLAHGNSLTYTITAEYISSTACNLLVIHVRYSRRIGVRLDGAG